METNAELQEKANKLLERIKELQSEQTRLANTSYSQSNPSAMMERRDVRRNLERVERQYDEIMKKLK